MLQTRFVFISSRVETNDGFYTINKTPSSIDAEYIKSIIIKFFIFEINLGENLSISG